MVTLMLVLMGTPTRPAVRQYNGEDGVYNPPSDTSSQQYALNSGHILMNNMAGSRAPLPGFSSFV